MTKSRVPDALRLRKHLDACTVPELEEFLRFWAPHEKRKNGRARLVEDLYRLMSDENVVFAKVDLLSERVRAVLMGLLRTAHYTSDLQGLFRGIDGLEMEYYEAEAALTALSRRGFVRISRAQEWLQHGRSSYAIPREMALVMRGLAGTDRRPLDQVFVHETFQPNGVEVLPEDERADLPAAVHDAIASLPGDDLQAIATEVIREYGGILTRHEFAERFGPRDIRWDSARFLEEFGQAGLGTLGHIDLRTHGLGVDDDALLFFHEAVEGYIAEWRREPIVHDRVLTAHGDLMSDVRTTLQQIREQAVKVSKEGSVYKAARGRLADRLQFARQPLVDRTDIADRALSITRGLHLAETNGDNQLAVTEKGENWMRAPLIKKVRDAYDLLFCDEVQTLRSHHLRHVHAIIVELLTTQEGWWPGASLGLSARNRYLLELVRDEAPLHGARLSVRHSALTELGRAAADICFRDLFALGLVDVAVKDDAPVGVRLSRLGRRLLLEAEAEPARKALVVNPDFEVLVLPEGDVDDLLHELDRIATRERTGEVKHYRLDRARIERYSVAGEAIEEILDFLAEHSRADLPQNVIYSVRSWSSDVRSATLEPGVLLVASDKAVVQSILGHPALRECVLRVVDDTTVFFSEDVLDRALQQELRGLGVYLR